MPMHSELIESQIKVFETADDAVTYLDKHQFSRKYMAIVSVYTVDEKDRTHYCGFSVKEIEGNQFLRVGGYFE